MDNNSSAFVISLDFELHWGVFDHSTINDYRANLQGTRAAITAILELFEEFSIEATWATVGFLFCESKEELLSMLPDVRPQYQNPALNPYRMLDEIGEGEQDDPYHFAPSVIRQIADIFGQEIATHTFSHYYCLEPGQNIECFRADIKAAMKIAAARGHNIKSIVFPRNQMNPAYKSVLAEAGIIAYRDSPQAWMHNSSAAAGETRVRRAARLMDSYMPLANSAMLHNPTDRREEVPVNVSGSHFLRPYNARTRIAEPLRLHRILQLLNQAATTNTMYHLWWHPHNFGANLQENLSFLRQILTHFNRLRDTHGMKSYSMANYANRALSSY